MIRISQKRIPGTPQYTYGDSELPIASSTKILGVIFDRKLNWKLHLETVLSKARRMLGFCYRHTKEAGPDAFRVLYSSLVLSVVENCNLVWYPAGVTGREKIEAIQRKASKIVTYRKGPQFRDLSYHDRLKKVHWTSLERRVQVKQLKFIQRIFTKNFSDTPKSGLISNFSISNRTHTIQPIGSRTVIL